MIILLTFLSFAHAAMDCSVLAGFHHGKTAVTENTCAQSEKYLLGYSIGRKIRSLDHELGPHRGELELAKRRLEALKFEVTPAQFNIHLGGFYTKKGVKEDFEREVATIASMETHQDDLGQLAREIDDEWGRKDSLIKIYHSRWGKGEIDVGRDWKETLQATGGFQNLSPNAKTVMQQETKGYGIIGQGLAAIFIGFGSGHALQQRYWQTGWKYTLLDGATAGLITSSNSNLRTLGMLSLLAVRLTQGVSVFDRPYVQEAHVEKLQTAVDRHDKLFAAVLFPIYQTTF